VCGGRPSSRGGRRGGGKPASQPCGAAARPPRPRGHRPVAGGEMGGAGGMAWAAGDFCTQPETDQLGGARGAGPPNPTPRAGLGGAGGGFRHTQTRQFTVGRVSTHPKLTSWRGRRRGPPPEALTLGVPVGAMGGQTRRGIGVHQAPSPSPSSPGRPEDRYISWKMGGYPVGSHHHGPRQRYILTTMGPDPAPDRHGPAPRRPGRPSPATRGGGGCQKGRRGRGGPFSTHPNFSTHPKLASSRWATRLPAPPRPLRPPELPDAWRRADTGRAHRQRRRNGDDAGVVGGLRGWSRENGRILTKSA
jgi:hypothetical protein